MSLGLIDPNKFGPWAVIAGASDGTGAGFAREVAKSGVNVLLIARRLPELERLGEEIRRDYPVEIRILQLDLSAADAVEEMAQAAEDIEVGLYISNAGADTGAGPFLDNPLHLASALVQRNILTVTGACYHFAGKMRQRGHGGILLMASGTGLGGQIGYAVYAGTEGYILNFAESLWGELRPFGVDVVAIAAPMMNTPTLQRLLGKVQFPGMYEPIDVVRTALSRLPAGCSYIYAGGHPDGESERQSDARRERLEMIHRLTSSFGKGG